METKATLETILGFDNSEENLGRLVRAFEYLLEKAGSVEKRYYSIAELSKYMGISKNTLYQWVHMRQVPYYKVKGLVRFDKYEIDKWLKKKRVKVFDYKKALDLV